MSQNVEPENHVNKQIHVVHSQLLKVHDDAADHERNRHKSDQVHNCHYYNPSEPEQFKNQWILKVFDFAENIPQNTERMHNPFPNVQNLTPFLLRHSGVTDSVFFAQRVPFADAYQGPKNVEQLAQSMGPRFEINPRF